jgi:aspartate dehydrogenase
MRRVGLIGFGAIGGLICELWPQHLMGVDSLAAVLVRPDQVSRAAQRLGEGVAVSSDPSVLLDGRLDMVIEAAGHGAVIDHGEAILRAGLEFHVLSAGALADDTLRQGLHAASAAGGGRVFIPAGALAGFDGLLSMRTAGLKSVKYTSTKPVEAWRGTPAETFLKRQDIDCPRVIFSGSAREAAQTFPRNANLAAAVALAGIGFERTQVELVADPWTTVNSGRLEAASVDEHLDVMLSSAAFAESPKTSRITAMSAIAALREQSAAIGFH